MEYVTLANGKKVDWDEFSKWSVIKQTQNINPSCKGKKCSEETKIKIRQARKNDLLNGTAQFLMGGENCNARKVSTPNGVFETIKEAGIFYKVGGSKIKDWIKKGKEGFLFLSPPISRNAPKNKGGLSGSSHCYARAVITPSGRFGTLKEAAYFLGISAAKLRNIILTSSNGEYRYESERMSCKIRMSPISKRIMTPAGEFETIASAAIHFGINAESMRYRAKSVHMPEFYILDAPSI
jgi:hypothetical protein